MYSNLLNELLVFILGIVTFFIIVKKGYTIIVNKFTVFMGKISYSSF